MVIALDKILHEFRWFLAVAPEEPSGRLPCIFAFECVIRWCTPRPAPPHDFEVPRQLTP